MMWTAVEYLEWPEMNIRVIDLIRLPLFSRRK